MRVPRTAKSGTLGKLMVYAPVLLQVISMLRRSQQKTRGKYVKARKRDRLLDTLLNQAERKLGGKSRSRRWF
ncbi:hypothetical protein [Deinococcus koreensis]|uniref:Uncharacterized protein n=1 Tax=Deinococcus koreensis TaxID=2054903 RepID=A0A2K3UWB6_9DEIO|nr:hypothetical protein [Deinococcus koreensis]PNY80826.1 hypothetical protein CVO96_05075 [Deinococcus koreensis]